MPIVLITGGNSGIGLGAAQSLAKDSKNTIIIAARSLEKNKFAVDSIKKSSGNQNITSHQLDLSSLDSVSKFAKMIKNEYPSIDSLVCNAGILLPKYQKSVDGYEKTFATNHLGHFLLINMLLPILKGDNPHLVIVSSFTINPKNFSGLKYPNLTTGLDQVMFKEETADFNAQISYTNSKLLNALTGTFLSRNDQIRGNVSVSVYDPGYVVTDIMREGNNFERFMVSKFWPFVMKPFWSKVSTIEVSGGYLSKLAIEGENGVYYSCTKKEEIADRAKDIQLQDSVWNQSLELVKGYL